MIEFNCAKCDCFYKVKDGFGGKTVRCKKCGHTTKVPMSMDMSFGYFPDIEYMEDGITPNFDELFTALSKEEREAPTL
ncbi:MAG: hypothetical protein ACYSUT_02795 [Planctomycetota bacterium]|jgi:hypothetical protein